MNSLAALLPAGSAVLVLGAHCDDVEIGAGGMLATLSHARPDLRIVWRVFSAEAGRAEETAAAARRLLPGATVDLEVAGFHGSHFPADWTGIKAALEALKPLRPALVLTHCRGDLHQDHRVIHELTWNTFRDHLILEYEIPKFDGDLGQPNAFFPLSREQLDRKVALLMDCFPSQRGRGWFTPETFIALARIRGIECAAPEGYAEAFYLRKARLQFGAA